MTNRTEELTYWIVEREHIRGLKEEGWDKPWSDDPIFHSTYFCNVNREDDKTTRWIRDNWSAELAEMLDMVLAMTVARLFNHIGTLSSLPLPIPCQPASWLGWVSTTLTERYLKGDQLWSGAYMITTSGAKISKLDHCLRVIRGVYETFQHYRVGDITTLQGLFDRIVGVDGLGPFLAAQIVADVKNSNVMGFGVHAKDHRTFSAHGPGSLRGLSWYFNEKVTPKYYKDRISTAYEEVVLELPSHIHQWMCMQNFQNCLCEFDKYMRIKTGTGKSKRNYDGNKKCL